MTATTRNRQIAAGTKVETYAGLVGSIGSFLSNDLVQVINHNDEGRVVRHEVAYDDIITSDLPESVFLDRTPAENMRARFLYEELASVRDFASAGGRPYLGRAVEFPEDPWGTASSRRTDTFDPWWVQANPVDAIESALDAVVPWSVAVEVGRDGTRYVLVVDRDGNEVVPESECTFAADVRAVDIVVSMLNLLNAER